MSCSLGSKTMLKCPPVCPVQCCWVSPVCLQGGGARTMSCMPHMGKMDCHHPSGSAWHLTCEKMRGLSGRPVLCDCWCLEYWATVFPQCCILSDAAANVGDINMDPAPYIIQTNRISFSEIEHFSLILKFFFGEECRQLIPSLLITLLILPKFRLKLINVKVVILLICLEIC